MDFRPQAVTGKAADISRPWSRKKMVNQRGSPCFSPCTRPGAGVQCTWRIFSCGHGFGRGIGKALLEKVAALAVERGCVVLYWHVLDWNTPAIDFYKTLGAEALDDWTRMRVTDDALRALAGAALRVDAQE